MRRPFFLVVLMAVAVLAAIAPASPGAAAGAPSGGGTTTTGAEGLAYGVAGRLTHADLADVRIGRVAPQTLPCLPEDGRVYQRRAVDVTFPADGTVLASTTVTDRGSATVVGARLDVMEQSRIEGLTMLGGLVTADGLTATSRTSFGPDGFARRGTVDVLDLRIGTATFDGSVARDTRVDLPGVGYVVVNEQRRTGNGTTSGGLEVNGLRVHLDSAVGYRGEVVVAHADTMVDRPSGTDHTVGGYAHVLAASVRPVLTVHPQGASGMPCNGGDAASDILGVSFPAIGTSSGTGHTEVHGDVTAGGATSEASAAVEDLALLGVIDARAVTATAGTSGTPGSVASTGGATFVDLVIAGGEPIDGSVPPNTRVAVPGLGYAVLNQQVCQSDGADPRSCTAAEAGAITVTAVRVVVRVSDNSFGLPVGATVNVAVAHTDVAL